jgi:hypothetical protein
MEKLRKRVLDGDYPNIDAAIKDAATQQLRVTGE